EHRGDCRRRKRVNRLIDSAARLHERRIERAIVRQYTGSGDVQLRVDGRRVVVVAGLWWMDDRRHVDRNRGLSAKRLTVPGEIPKAVAADKFVPRKIIEVSRRCERKGSVRGTAARDDGHPKLLAVGIAVVGQQI